MNADRFLQRIGLALGVALSVSLTPLDASALRLPPVFGDHMVLQRERPITIWGEGPPGESVTVTLSAEASAPITTPQIASLHSASTTVSADGTWRLTLAAQPASSAAHTLAVRSATAEITFSDVLLGEVWLCSGQSNMEKPLGPRAGQRPTDNYKAALAAATHPRLRLFQVPHSGRVKRPDAQLRWLPCSGAALTTTDFSAAAYYFGVELLAQLDVPIGLIHASYGGTQIEAWMPPAAFTGPDADPVLAPLRTQRYFAWVEGVQATELYTSMLAPLVPYTLRGFLWYQGEANCMQADGLAYTAKQRALIQHWRASWQAPEAPFLYALLAPFNYSRWDKFPKHLAPEALPLFWEAQVAVAAPSIPPPAAEPSPAASLAATAFIVTTDLAGQARDIHPTNKHDVGRRFAQLAIATTYRDSTPREQAAAAPLTLSPILATPPQRLGDGRLALRFTVFAGGLPLRTRDGAAPTHFSIAGADRTFHPALASLDPAAPDTVFVSHPQVTSPVAVRFAWHETAAPNLTDAQGLPAVPFRTDDWLVASERRAPSPPSPSPETIDTR